MADKHSGTLLGAGTALIAVGGIFMAVTGFEPTKTPGTVWANTWLVLGFAVVVLGTLIVAVGVVLHFRREVPGRLAPEAVPPPAVAALPADAIDRPTG